MNWTMDYSQFTNVRDSRTIHYRSNKMYLRLLKITITSRLL